MSKRKRMSIRLLLTGALLMVCGACATLQDSSSVHYAPNPEAVQEVLSGERTVANARWWGFDADDATQCLQAAIDSGARTVIVPYMGHDWIVRPITLRSNQEIIFEPGVVVRAKKGEFKGRNDSLFSAAGASNITLRGYGATLRMRKKDYMTEEYAKAEWRMVLKLLSCKRITVLGLNLESSGGDGIYIGVSGDEQPYCEDIVIRDVTCYDNYRQGISVISAVNLLVENCVLANTWGTPPGAGIDLEPNNPSEKLVNCVVRNCIMEENEGAGILVYLKNLSRQSDPVSVRFENCYVRSGKDVGIGVGAITDDGPEGLILFENCTVENTAKGGIFIYDKSADSVRVRFANCNWDGVGMAEHASRLRAPLQITLVRSALTEKLGGIEFADCYLYDSIDRPALAVQARPELGVHDIKGQITVRNPHGARMELPSKQVDVDLNIVEITE